MTRLVPVFVSMILLGPLLTAAAAATDSLPAKARQEQASRDAMPVTPSPVPKSNDGRIPVTRSDGSTGFAKPSDERQIRKLVGYMRDGMNHASRSEQQRSKKVIYKKK